MNEWFSQFLSSESPLFADVVRSAVLVFILVVGRFALLRTVFKRNPGMRIESKQRWYIGSRNAVILGVLVSMLIIWASELQSFALSMMAVAAATVLATKELIMCVSGGLVRATGKLYRAGDYIEIGQYRGRVVDMNVFSTVLMEVGPGHLTNQTTGRTTSIPNSLLLSTPVFRENHMGEFTIHTFMIPAPYSLDPIKASKVLQDSAEELCMPYLAQAKAYVNALETERMYQAPSAAPRITIVAVDDKHYKFIVRMVIPVRERQHIQQSIMQTFLFTSYGKPADEPDIVVKQ
ncbi:MAG: mechanosensitive ion channel domain-containing protein [Neisseriaceae bacterium]